MQSMRRGAWMTLTSVPRRHVTIGGGQMMTCREIAKVGQLILNRCAAARPPARPPACLPARPFASPRWTACAASFRGQRRVWKGKRGGPKLPAATELACGRGRWPVGDGSGNWQQLVDEQYARDIGPRPPGAVKRP